MLSLTTILLFVSSLTAVQAHVVPRAASNPLERIDTHSHVVPPFWREETTKYGYAKPDGMPGIPQWSEAAHLQFMKNANITKSIVSITSPGTHLVAGNDALNKDLSRRCNKFAADLKKRNPNQFGFWAALPIPNVKDSLAEIKYAFDTLNADGVGLYTNYQGVYLGDPKLQPIFDELNRRNATIFIHPTSACRGDGKTSTPSWPLDQYPRPMFEFLFDTARAVVNLFLSGTMAKVPNVTIILSHAGGAITPIVTRFTEFANVILHLETPINTAIVKDTFNRQFYFDLAGFVFPDQIQGLLPYVGASRITYGSDYPYTSEAGALGLSAIMAKELPKVFPSAKEQKAVYKGNAEKILKKKKC